MWLLHPTPEDKLSQREWVEVAPALSQMVVSVWKEVAELPETTHPVSWLQRQWWFIVELGLVLKTLSSNCIVLKHFTEMLQSIVVPCIRYYEQGDRGIAEDWVGL